MSFFTNIPFCDPIVCINKAINELLPLLLGLSLNDLYLPLRSPTISIFEPVFSNVFLGVHGIGTVQHSCQVGCRTESNIRILLSDHDCSLQISIDAQIHRPLIQGIQFL